MTAPTLDFIGLIDTGAIVALLNKADKWHDKCVDAHRALGGPLATTAAVLVEVFHLIRERTRDPRRATESAWRLIASEAIAVVAIDDRDLPRLEALMTKYADRPMDFADATLVHVAERLSTNVVFTIDHNDFETYRVDGRPFQIAPSRTS